MQNKKTWVQYDQLLLVDGTGMLGTNRDAFKMKFPDGRCTGAAPYAGYLPVSGYARNDQTYSLQPDCHGDQRCQYANLEYWTTTIFR